MAERFRHDLTAALGRRLHHDDRLLLGVSGGVDSMAMLALARSALPDRVEAATVDHGLRVESSREAAGVADWCATHAVPHATLVITRSPGASGNLQDWARRERYAALRRHAADRCCTILSTAHHLGDQVETFLMRAARGAGLAGLGAIRARRSEGNALTVVRPLLGWRQAELRSVAETLRLPVVQDPSNVDDRFDRTRVRRWVAAAPWPDLSGFGEAAAHAAEGEADLLAIGSWLWSERRIEAGDLEQAVDVAGLPRGVCRIIARIGIDAARTSHGILRPAYTSATNIEPLLDALARGKAATQAGILVSPNGSVWRFRPAAARRSL